MTKMKQRYEIGSDQSARDYNKERADFTNLIAPQNNMTLNSTIDFEMHTSEKGLLLLVERLKEASHVWNTRIIGKGVDKIPYTPRVNAWSDAIVEFVKLEDTYFHEIISTSLERDAHIQQLLLESDYKAFRLNNQIDAFINFIIIEYKNGKKEVWLGWLYTEHKGLEQPCFVFNNNKFVKLYEALFDELLKNCTRIHRG